MKNRTSPLLFLLPLLLALAAGGAHAQFKAPTKPQGKDGLGSGLGSGLGTSSSPTIPAPATPSPPPASGAPAAGGQPSSAEEVVQEIANCVLGGLPPGWTLAQIEVREISRSDKQRDFEAVYSYLDGAGKAAPFVPCDPREPALNVYKLNGALDPAKRNWIRATLVLSNEGKFELQYDYTAAEAAREVKPTPAPAAKKDSRKDAAKKK